MLSNPSTLPHQGSLIHGLFDAEAKRAANKNLFIPHPVLALSLGRARRCTKAGGAQLQSAGLSNPGAPVSRSSLLPCNQALFRLTFTSHDSTPTPLQ